LKYTNTSVCRSAGAADGKVCWCRQQETLWSKRVDRQNSGGDMVIIIKQPTTRNETTIIRVDLLVYFEATMAIYPLWPWWASARKKIFIYSHPASVVCHIFKWFSPLSVVRVLLSSLAVFYLQPLSKLKDKQKIKITVCIAISNFGDYELRWFVPVKCTEEWLNQNNLSAIFPWLHSD